MSVKMFMFGIALQTEKEYYIKKLEAESKLVSQLRCQTDSRDVNDQEISDLHQQLNDLQVFTAYSIF